VPTPQQKQESWIATATFAHGVSFVLTLPADADAHYAGKGRENSIRPIARSSGIN